jgi:ADP-heptose:LPS heptosyltransferase
MTDLFSLENLLKSVPLLITVNTFTMHLGIALGVPTVAIIGGTPASVVAPRDNPKFKYVENVDNINAITVDEVMEKVDELLR